MEKYGCNRLEEINSRIRELSQINHKTACEQAELKDLRQAKFEIEEEMATDSDS